MERLVVSGSLGAAGPLLMVVHHHRGRQAVRLSLIRPPLLPVSGWGALIPETQIERGPVPRGPYASRGWHSSVIFGRCFRGDRATPEGAGLVRWGYSSDFWYANHLIGGRGGPTGRPPPLFFFFYT